MTKQALELPLDLELELDKGTVVSFYLSGEYTLEWTEDGKPDIDVPYNLEFIERGGMDEAQVEAEIKGIVDRIMEPICYTDPKVVAHLQGETIEPQQVAQAPRRPRT